jgi:hypothetical protein
MFLDREPNILLTFSQNAMLTTLLLSSTRHYRLHNTETNKSLTTTMFAVRVAEKNCPFITYLAVPMVI